MIMKGLLMAVKRRKEVTRPTFVFWKTVSQCNICTKHSHLQIARKQLFGESLQLR